MDMHLMLTLRRLRQEIFEAKTSLNNKEIRKYISVTTSIGYDPFWFVL